MKVGGFFIYGTGFLKENERTKIMSTFQSMNAKRYQAYPKVELKNRQWADKVITQAPIWCSVDLRDGNQALSIPMSVEEKIVMFDVLVKLGFKEIEVGFPSASDIEFSFIRKLIEGNYIPEDVTIQVLTAAKEPLIQKTFESLKGVKKAIVHMYNSTSVLQRKVVFQKTKKEVIALTVDGAKIMKRLREHMEDSYIQFQYSPESFTGTELDFTLEICHAVMDVWQPSIDNQMIINLPSTVEMSTPNIYADQIEWFCQNVKNRENIIMSVHPHNDRGTAVASGELAILAGADRVEGTLFGNGERTGNVDIVTMALNIFSQGIDSRLKFSDINKVREIYEHTTRMTVHPRHPYVGELVYTAFSGSHQDAIRKGMKAQNNKKDDRWEVPYLPIDPKDVGRNYESIIRINSQSGKGGVAYIMEQEFGFHLPKLMHPEFGRIIKQISSQKGYELSPNEIWECFEKEYLINVHPYEFKNCVIETMNENKKIKEGKSRVQGNIIIKGRTISFQGEGNGPIDAFVKGLRKISSVEFKVDSYFEHGLTKGSDSRAVAYVGIDIQNQIIFGVGVDENISIASIKAVIHGLNRYK